MPRQAKQSSDYSWIDNDPLQEEIRTNDDESEFIPIHIVENLLYKIDDNWGTENFKFRIFTIEERVFASSSVELVLTMRGKIRRLVGASTFQAFGGESVESISLSESIKNASKKLGKRFGRDLNGRSDMLVKKNDTPTPQKNGKQKPPAVKMKPDSKIQKQYDDAMDRLDTGMMQLLESIYEFNQPEKTTTNAES